MEVMTTSPSMAEQVSAQPEFGPQMPLSEKLLALAIRAQNFTGASGIAVAIREGQEVVCRASWGTSAPDVGVRLQDQNSFTYQCMRAGKAMRCDDAYSDPRVDNAACQALGIRSIAAAPVGSGSDVLGVIAAFSEDASAFTETHVIVLTTLGEVVCKFLKDAQPVATAEDDLLAIEDELPELVSAPVKPPEDPKSVEPPEAAPAVETSSPAAEPAKQAPIKPTTPQPTVSSVAAKTPPAASAQAPAKPGLEFEREPEIRPDAMVSDSDIPRDPSLVNSDALVPPLPLTARLGSKLASLGDKRPAWLGMIDAAVKKSAPTAESPSKETKPPVVTSAAPKIGATSPLPKVGAPATPPATDSIKLAFTEPAEPVLVDRRKYLIRGGAAAVLVLILGLWTWHSHRANQNVVETPPPVPAQQQVADNDPSFQTPPVEEAQAPAPARTAEKPANQKPSARKEKDKDDGRSDATAEDTVRIVNKPIRKPGTVSNPSPEPELPPTVTVSSATLPADLLAVKTAMPTGPALQTSHFVPSEVTTKVTPVYPEMAKRSHVHGKVVLAAKIDATGKVQDVKVLNGPPAFRQAAVEAVRRWKYKPALLNGQAVESNAEITLNFSSN